MTTQKYEIGFKGAPDTVFKTEVVDAMSEDHARELAAKYLKLKVYQQGSYRVYNVKLIK